VIKKEIIILGWVLNNITPPCGAEKKWFD